MRHFKIYIDSLSLSLVVKYKKKREKNLVATSIYILNPTYIISKLYNDMISLLFAYLFILENRFDNNNNKDDYEERKKKHQKTDKFKVDSI